LSAVEEEGGPSLTVLTIKKGGGGWAELYLSDR
jgi:hypothetical protein